MLDDADRARFDGRLGDAAAMLRQVATLWPRDPRGAVALFTLGRVESERQRHEAAARAFDACARHAPEGPLSEDALAAAARAWAAAGAPEKAKERALRYLARFGGGVHTDEMRRLASAG